MSIPNFSGQPFCKYRTPPQKDGAAAYVIDVTKSMIGSLLGCLLAMAIASTVVQYRMQAKMRDAMQDVQQDLQDIKIPQMPNLNQ